MATPNRIATSATIRKITHAGRRRITTDPPAPGGSDTSDDVGDGGIPTKLDGESEDGEPGGSDEPDDPGSEPQEVGG